MFVFSCGRHRSDNLIMTVPSFRIVSGVSQELKNRRALSGPPANTDASSENSTGHDESHAHVTAHVTTQHAIHGNPDHEYPPQLIPIKLICFISHSFSPVKRKKEILFPVRSGCFRSAAQSLSYFKKPRYSSNTLNSISPEHTGRTASDFPMGANSKTSRAAVSTKTGITSYSGPNMISR